MFDVTLYIFPRFFFSSAIPSSFTTLRIIVKSTAFINVYLKYYSIFNVTLYSTIALCKIYIVHVPRILSPFFRLSPIYASIYTDRFRSINYNIPPCTHDKQYKFHNTVYCQKLSTFIPRSRIIIIVRNYSRSPFPK